MFQQKMELNQQLKLTQQFIQSLNILALNQAELVEFIETLYTENPCVEISYQTDAHDDFILNESAFRKQQPDDQQDFADLLEAPADINNLAESLLSQINFSRLPPSDTGIIQFIVNNLDDSGFYPLSPEETVQFLPHSTPKEVERCLTFLQSLEPCGVCCRDLKQCLCHQLQNLGEDNPAFFIMIEHCLPLFAEKKYQTIHHRFQIDYADMEAFQKILGRLNPKPGASFGTDSSQYIIPDLFIVQKDGSFLPILNDKYIPRIFISNSYCNIPSADPETQKYIEHKINSAQWAIRCLEKRNETILHLTQEIIHANEPFFLSGKGPLSYLKMQDLAERLQVHPSTISRCVRGKYLQCTYGTYPLKSFFHNSSEINDALFFSPETDNGVLTALRVIIEKEDKAKPLSDGKLAAILEKEGFHVARRTIAKYRGLLHIPSSVDRKNAPSVH